MAMTGDYVGSIIGLEGLERYGHGTSLPANLLSSGGYQVSDISDQKMAMGNDPAIAPVVKVPSFDL